MSAFGHHQAHLAPVVEPDAPLEQIGRFEEDDVCLLLCHVHSAAGRVTALLN